MKDYSYNKKGYEEFILSALLNKVKEWVPDKQLGHFKLILLFTAIYDTTF